MQSFVSRGNYCTTHKVPGSCGRNPSKALQYLLSTQADLMVGDLVVLGNEVRYRNDGTYIYDGEKIISLDYEKFGYGCLHKISHQLSSEPRLTIGITPNRGYSTGDSFGSTLDTIAQQRSAVMYGILPGSNVYGIYLMFKHKDKDYVLIYPSYDEDCDIIDDETLEYKNPNDAEERRLEFESKIEDTQGNIFVSLVDPVGMSLGGNALYFFNIEN